MTNIPFTSTLTFTTATEAADYLAVMGYTRMPVAGAVVRLSAEKWDDFGVRYISFANVSSRHDDGSVTYQTTDYGRTDT